MKRVLKFLLILLILVAIGVVIFHFIFQNNRITPVTSKQNIPAESQAQQQSTQSVNSIFEGTETSNIDLKSEAAILIDADNGKTFYSKNPHKKLYPASLTKLMTALIFSKKDSKNTILTYNRDAKDEPSNKLDFAVGTQITADNAMKGMLIFSANDLATMTADNISGSTASFSGLMNSEAATLGMQDTHFVSANGLHNSNHYTTVYDLSILARKVYKVDWIMNCLGMPSAHITTRNGKGVTVYNTNKALDKEGCFAGKTGTTSEAGYCLAAYYKRNGRVLIGIILHSPNESSLYADMGTMVSAAL